jgi:pimeloyl-ACP methyl ester carboxylesterase
VQSVAVWTEALGVVPVEVSVVGEGPPLLLLAPLGRDTAALAPLQASLAGWRVWAVALPGGGGTAMPARRMAPMALVDWAEQLALELGIRGCPVVGLGVGGWVALQWALRHPRSVGRLCVVSPPVAPHVRLRGATLAARCRAVPGLAGRYLREVVPAAEVAALWRHLARREEEGARFPVRLAAIFLADHRRTPVALSEALDLQLHGIKVVKLDGDDPCSTSVAAPLGEAIARFVSRTRGGSATRATNG